ncbi:hypothetical protein QMK31_00205 [Cryobacterium sp. PH31-O1]|nr:hypothetical protein [Cryobacterium sp. PH31-O1]
MDNCDDRVRQARESDFPPNDQNRTGWVAYNPIVYAGTYSPLITAPLQIVEPGVVSESPAADEVDVWLTQWQVAEYNFQVSLTETTTWKLIPMDNDWITRLFDDRRVVPLQLDMYAEATRDLGSPDWTVVNGVVVRVDQVSVEYVPSSDPSETARVPKHGAAVVHTVTSIWPVQPHHGLIAGWIVRIRLNQGV